MIGRAAAPGNPVRLYAAAPTRRARTIAASPAATYSSAVATSDHRLPAAPISGDPAMPTRRQFLGHTSALAGSLLLTANVATLAHAADTGGMLKRRIPATGATIPAIGMGTSGSFEVAAGSIEYEALK